MNGISELSREKLINKSSIVSGLSVLYLFWGFQRGRDFPHPNPNIDYKKLYNNFLKIDLIKYKVLGYLKKYKICKIELH